MGNRPVYRGYANRYGGGRYDRDHDRHRHPYFPLYGYGYGYPGWYGYPYYPYVIDPGFYDWSDSGDYGDDQGSYPYAPYADSDYGQSANPDASGEPAAGYPAEPPYPGYGTAPYNQPQGYTQPAPGAAPPQIKEYHFASPSSGSSESNEPLRVIFKDNRAPVMIQNYMINSTSLTDLDGGGYQTIPLDQIDIAATVQANRSRGIHFQVPGISHN